MIDKKTETQVWAEYHVAARGSLKRFNELEAPLRLRFETDRKPFYDQYLADCKQLQIIRDKKLSETEN